MIQIRFPGSMALLLLALAAAACGAKETPLTQLTPADLWDRGMAEYEEEEWEEAIRYFDRFALVGGTDPRVSQARYYSAQAHFEREEYITAAADFARLSIDVGRGELADDARFMACRAYEELSPDAQLDQEYTRAAINHCQALIDYFPGTEFADQARDIITRMRAKLAAKLYETGDWYRGRRAYDSAIIYFDDVVAQYPQTEWAPRALRRLVEIYGILQWEDEREEMRERLLREYPDSEAARALANSPGAGGAA